MSASVARQDAKVRASQRGIFSDRLFGLNGSVRLECLSFAVRSVFVRDGLANFWI